MGVRDREPLVRRLTLDHLTAGDTTPSKLVEIAARVGCAGVGLFLQPMEMIAGMPMFAVTGNTPERRATRDAMRAGDVKLDIAYPFTLTGRSVVEDFEPLLETAAWLGGRLANVLCYDHDAARRADRLSALAELARGYGIALALEFYPPSQVRSLAEALATLKRAHHDGIGVTLDLLHLMRAGELPAALPRLADPRVRIAQLSDGPATIAADQAEREAGSERLLPGDGAFDIAGFVAGLAPGCPVTVEVPRRSALAAGLSAYERARIAVAATRAVLGEPPADACR